MYQVSGPSPSNPFGLGLASTSFIGQQPHGPGTSDVPFSPVKKEKQHFGFQGAVPPLHPGHQAGVEYHPGILHGHRRNDSAGESAGSRGATPDVDLGLSAVDRRQKKSLREKQRRNEINEQFERLAFLLGLTKKTEKGTIMSEAIGAIQNLRRDVEDLQGQVQLLKSEMHNMSVAALHNRRSSAANILDSSMHAIFDDSEKSHHLRANSQFALGSGAFGGSGGQHLLFAPKAIEYASGYNQNSLFDSGRGFASRNNSLAGPNNSVQMFQKFLPPDNSTNFPVPPPEPQLFFQHKQ